MNKNESRTAFGARFLRRMSFGLVLPMALLGFLASAVPTFADIAHTIGYQGRLKDSAGNPLTSTFNFTFRIYDASSGGSPVWAETQSGIPTSQGFFAVNLGSVTPFPTSVDFNKPLYLTTEVNTDGEMSPRIPINSVAYAFTTEGVGAYPSAPISATGGRMYYDVSLGTLNYYDATNGIWQSLSTTSTTGTSSFTSLNWTNATGTSVTTTNLFATNAIFSNATIAGQAVCLLDGTGCPAAATNDTLASVTARGSFATTTLQLYGGFIGSSSTVTSTFTVLGTTALGTLTFTNGTATSVTTTWLGSGTVSTTRLFVNGQAIGAGVPATTATLQQITSNGASTANTLSLLGGFIGSSSTVTSTFTVLGATALQALTATNAIFTNSTATWLGFATASGTSLFATNATFATATVAGQSLCLANGSGCPNAIESDTLASVTARGAFTTSTLQLYGGFMSGSSTVTSTFTVLGGLFSATGVTIGATSTIYGDGTIYKASAGDFSFALNNASSSLRFFVGATGTNSFTVASTSRIGINNPNPQTSLDVGGSITNILQTNLSYAVVSTTLTGNAPLGIAVQGRYAYVVNSSDNTISVIDVNRPTDASNVNVVATVNVGATPVGITVSGRYAYVANSGSNSLSVVDISRPASPTVVGSVVVGTQPAVPFVSGRFVYVTNNGSNSLSVVDIADPTNPRVASTVSVGTQPARVFVQGRYAYVTNFASASLSIVDITDPFNPTVNTTAVGNAPVGIAVQGRYAYVANGNALLSVIDVSDSANPITVSTAPITAGTSNVLVSGRYAYVTNRNANSLQIFDISNSPNAPQLISTVPAVGAGALASAISGRYLYITNYFGNNISVVDIKGLETNGLNANNAEIGSLSVLTNSSFYNQVSIGGGLDVGTGGIFSAGGLTGGSLIVGSPGNFQVDKDGVVQVNEQNLQPANPPVGSIKFYTRDVNGVPVYELLDSDGVVRHLGSDLDRVVFNNTSSSILKGQAVYLTGSFGGEPTVALAQANSVNTMPAVGLALETIPASEYGRIVTAGHLDNFNTSAYSAGDVLYVSPSTPGGLTKAKPSIPPDLTQKLGYVVEVGAVSGSVELVINPPNGQDTGTIFDNWTVGSGLAGTKTLQFIGSGTGTLAWNPTANDVITILDATGVMAMSNATLTVGSVPFAASNGVLAQDNANFSWNAAVAKLQLANVSVTSSARFSSDTLINNTGVCLADGTNCPSGTTPNFQTVTNTGNTTTNAIQFNGGTSTGAFRIANDLTVTGTTALVSLTFTNATGSAVTTTNLFSNVASFTNATAAILGVGGLSWVDATGVNVTTTNLFASNATIANLNVQQLTPTGLVWVNATGTNTTSTNLFAVNASTTNLNFSVAQGGDLSLFGMTNIQNLNFTNATGLNLETNGTVSSTFIHAQESTIGMATASILNVDTVLHVGVGNFPVIGNSVAQFGGTTDTFLQVNSQNHSTGTNASTDYIATADNGDDSNYYIDLGINGSNYSNPAFSITGPNDGYLYAQGADLALGTASATTNIKFHAGGTTAADEVMRITSSHLVGIGTTNPSSTLDVIGDGRFTGTLTASTSTWQNASGTNLNIQTMVAANGTITNLSFANGTSTSWFGFATASGTTLNATAIAVNGSSVCLANGTNCPGTAASTSTLQQITNNGALTTNQLTLLGGFIGTSSTVTSTFTVLGTTVLQTLTATNATFTNVTATTLGATTVSTTQLYVASQLVCLQNGINCPAEADTLATVSARGSFATTTLQLYGGFIGASSTVTSTFTVIGGTTLGTLTFTNATGNNVTTTNLGVSGFVDTDLTPSQDGSLSLGSASLRWNANFASVTATAVSTTNLFGTNGSFSNLIWTHATGTSATTTNFFATNLTGTNGLFNGVSTTWLGAGVVSTSQLVVNGQTINAGAPATTATLQTITNNGASTINTLSLFGGFIGASSTVTSTFTVLGTTALQTLTASNATFSQVTTSFLGATTVSTTQLFVAGQQICLQSGSNCPAEADTLATVSARGSFATTTLQLYGGFIGASSTVTSTFTVIGGTTLGTLTFTNGTATAVTSTNLFASNATFTNESVSAATSTVWLGFATASGSVLNASAIFVNGDGVCLASGLNCPVIAPGTSTLQSIALNGASTTVTLLLNDGFIASSSTVTSDFTVLGTTALQGLTATNATITTAILTNATATTLGVFTASATTLHVAGQLVCLANGTNCPTGTTSDLQTVTNAGNTTTNAIQFAGGTSTGVFIEIAGNLTSSSTVTGTLSVLGTTALQTLTATNATFTNVTATTVSTTQLYVASQLVCLANGSNCPAEADTLATVSARGSFATSTLQLYGGFIGASSTVTSTFTVIGASTLGTLTFTNATGNNVTTTNLGVSGFVDTNLTPSQDGSLSLGSASLRWNASFASATATAVTTTNLFGTNGSFSNLIWTNATGTSATTTNFFATNLTGTNGLFNGVTTTWLGSGTVSTSRLVVNGQTVNAGAPATTATLQTITSNGASTINTLSLFGGFIGASSTVTSTFTVLGASVLQTLIATNATFTNVTATTLGATTVSTTELYVASRLVCLQNGTNCPGEADTLATVSARGSFATSTLQLYGGFIGASSTVTSTFTVIGGTTLGTLTFTNGTATAVTSTNLFSTNGTISNASFTAATSSVWLGFASASGTTLNTTAAFVNGISVCLANGTNCVYPASTSTLQQISNNGATTTNQLYLLGGYIAASSTVTSSFTVLGNSALQALTATNATFTAVSTTNSFTTTGSSTNLFAQLGTIGTLTGANGSFTNVTSTNWLGFTTASGTTLNALSILVNGSAVCLGNGTNCMVPNLTQVTAAGATTTQTLQLMGGMLAASSTVTSTFTVLGSTGLQALTFTNGTGTSVTSTNLFSTNGTISTLATTALTWVNATGTSTTSTNEFATNLSFTYGTSTSWFGFASASGTSVTTTNLVFVNATNSGLLAFTNTTATITMANNGSLNITDTVNNLLQMKDLSTNFGAALSAGAFMDRNSSIQEEFNTQRTSITADTAGTGGAGFGDGGGWGAYESTNCTISTVADAANGLMRETSGAATNGCLVTMDESANNIHGILTATNLPVLLMKVRPSATTFSYTFAGMSDATDGALTTSTNFIGFSSNGGSTWYGLTMSAGVTTSVPCVGQTVSTSQFALLMVEVRSTTDVHFFVDPDVSNGIQFAECGTGSQTNIPSGLLAPSLQYQVRTGGTANSFLDVDFFRAWQDDPKDGVITQPVVLPNFSNGSGLVQVYPANDPNMEAGQLVSLDLASPSLKVKTTDVALDPNMIGVVTTNPGLTLSNGTFDGVRVVTQGRASVRASVENGPIKAGDALTSASTPGYVMKLNQAGPMIGRALEAFDGQSSSGSTSTVVISVQSGYYLPTLENAILASASGTTSFLQPSGGTDEVQLPAGSQIAQGLQVGTLIVVGPSAFRGPITLGTHNAGRVKVEPEKDRLKVTFDTPYPYQPHVLVTPEVVQEPDAQGVDMTAWNGGYFVANVTKDGFEIRLPGGGYCNGYGHCPYRVWFNWIVVGVEGESTESPSEPPVTTSPMVEPPPVTTPVTVEPPVVESTDATSTEIIPDVTTSTDSGSVTTTAEAPVTEPGPPADDSMLNLEGPVDQSSTDSAETTPSDTP